MTQYREILRLSSMGLSRTSIGASLGYSRNTVADVVNRARLKEEELDKLLSWYGKIEARDIFHSLQGDCAKEKLIQVKKVFENYSDMVYQYTILRGE